MRSYFSRTITFRESHKRESIVTPGTQMKLLNVWLLLICFIDIKLDEIISSYYKC